MADIALAETAAKYSTPAALELALVECWTRQDRAAGRETAHEILPGLWLGGCRAQPPPGLTHVVSLWDDDRDDVPRWPVAAERQLVVRIRDDVDAQTKRKNKQQWPASPSNRKHGPATAPTSRTRTWL